MRKILTIALALTMCSGAVMAAENVGLFTDAAGTNCALNPANFALATVYVVHHTDAGRVSKFMVSDHLGLTPTGTSVTTGFVSIGTYAGGIEIAYPTCQVGDIVVGTMGYFHQMEVLGCGNNSMVVPHPASEIPGQVIAVDCAQPFGNVVPATGGRLWGGTNADACGGCTEPPLATQSTTWGGVKALYR